MSGDGADLVFRVLGPVEVAASPAALRTMRHQHRALLALLLLNAGRVVTIDHVVAALWGTRPPATAIAQVYNQVSVIRAVLRDADAMAELERRPAGYLLGMADDRLDLARFDRLVRQARTAAVPEVRAGLLRDAVALWRGQALAGVEAPYAEAARAELDERHAVAVEARFESELELGRHAEVVGELAAEVARRPLRERLVGQLMLALHRAGRTSEAVAAYDRTRRTLADEAGLDPGVELREIHKLILRGETSRPPAGFASVPTLPRPAQLPADLSWFTGRAIELEQLHDLANDQERPRTAVVSVIDGMAGVGKTALAVHAAHQLAEQYPDGQLFIELHGHTEGIAPVEAIDALDRLLRALGVPGDRIPTQLEDRAALYRSRLAGRRLLILLDNAATEAQVRPLLPGAPGCFVLVTSRRRLLGLDSAHLVSLGLLATPEAVSLLEQIIGPERFRDEPAQIGDRLVELCGGLPLAIRIAAARLRARPGWTLSTLIKRLEGAHYPLSELEAGQRSVTAALDLSYQQLAPGEQRTYRMLGLHSGSDIDAHATAALLGLAPDHAAGLLDQLVDSHLLHEPSPGRFVFHDLVRAHAMRVVAQAGTGPERREAQSRLLDYYRWAAAVAMDVAYPFERDRRPRVPTAAAAGPELPDRQRAVAWLDAELPNLLAAARDAAGSDSPDHVLHLSALLRHHLLIRGRYEDADTIHTRALALARAAGDRRGELDALTGLGYVDLKRRRHGGSAENLALAVRIARVIGDRTSEVDALIGLGRVHRQQGQPQRAASRFSHALRIARAIGDRTGEMEALDDLGYGHRLQGRYQQAATCFTQVLELARATGRQSSEIDALVGIGQIHLLHGRYEQATDSFAQALTIARSVGHYTGELEALGGIGHVYRMCGRYEQAATCFTHMLRVAQAAGNRGAELSAVVSLGHIHRTTGRYQEAAERYEHALAYAIDLGSRNMQFEAVHGLGRLRHAMGRPDDAVAGHRQALNLATQVHQPGDQARAHDGLAHAYHALNRHHLARAHWKHALEILAELGVDTTEEEEASVAAIRGHLAEL